MSTLEQQIEERRRAARDKRIKDKARDVAHVLGEKTGDDWKYKNVFAQDRLRIEYDYEYNDDGTNPTTVITFCGKEVFRADEFQVLCYIPGAWEERLEALHGDTNRTRKQDEKRHEARQAAAEKAAEAAERKKWGL